MNFLGFCFVSSNRLEPRNGNYSGCLVPEKPVWQGAKYAWNNAVCAPRRVGCSKIVIKICSKKYLFLVLLGC